MNFLISVAPTEKCLSVPPEQSYLSEYLLYPIYDKLVLYYPTTWVPNKVTLFGIFSTVLASLLLFTSMPSNTVFEPSYPTFIPASLILEKDTKWQNAPGLTPLSPTMIQPFFSNIFTSSNLLLFVCGLLNVIYCISDNTDGRLARRLKKASEIGEYLDHGLDCVTSLMSAFVSMSVLGISFSNVAVSVSVVAIGTIMSHTLHYEKHIFIWGNRFISVDEAMLFFCVANWIPIVIPQIVTFKVPQIVLNTLFPEFWAKSLYSLRIVEVLVIIYWISQAYVILGIIIKNWKMLFRLTTLALLLNVIILLSLIPTHTSHILTKGTSGYALGPFSYVAVWAITSACTSSTIVHTLIYARCAKLPQVDLLAIAGIIFVWFTFLTCPVGAMVVAVSWHIGQILYNVGRLQKGSGKVLRKER